MEEIIFGPVMLTHIWSFEKRISLDSGNPSKDCTSSFKTPFSADSWDSTNICRFIQKLSQLSLASSVFRGVLTLFAPSSGRWEQLPRCLSHHPQHFLGPLATSCSYSVPPPTQQNQFQWLSQTYPTRRAVYFFYFHNLGLSSLGQYCSVLLMSLLQNIYPVPGTGLYASKSSLLRKTWFLP